MCNCSDCLGRAEASFWQQHAQLASIGSFVLEQFQLAMRSRCQDMVAVAVRDLFAETQTLKTCHQFDLHNSAVAAERREDAIVLNDFSVALREKGAERHALLMTEGRLLLASSERLLLPQSLHELCKLPLVHPRVSLLATRLIQQKMSLLHQPLLLHLDTYGRRKIDEVCLLSSHQFEKSLTLSSKSPSTSSPSPAEGSIKDALKRKACDEIIGQLIFPLNSFFSISANVNDENVNIGKSFLSSILTIEFRLNPVNANSQSSESHEAVLSTAAVVTAARNNRNRLAGGLALVSALVKTFAQSALHPCPCCPCGGSSFAASPDESLWRTKTHASQDHGSQNLFFVANLQALLSSVVTAVSRLKNIYARFSIDSAAVRVEVAKMTVELTKWFVVSLPSLLYLDSVLPPVCLCVSAVSAVDVNVAVSVAGQEAGRRSWSSVLSRAVEAGLLSLVAMCRVVSSSCRALTANYYCACLGLEDFATSVSHAALRLLRHHCESLCVPLDSPTLRWCEDPRVLLAVKAQSPEAAALLALLTSRTAVTTQFL